MAHAASLVRTLITGSLLALAAATDAADIPASTPATMAPVAAAAVGKVEDFALLDHTGRYHQLSTYRDSPVIVLFVTGVGCPIVRQNIGVVSKLAHDYAAKNVRFFLIDPNAQDKRKEIAEEAGKLAIDLPILIDDSQLIGESLDLKRTAEALVIRTKDWKLLWRGPVDDRVGYGGQKTTAAHNYLGEAIDAVLAGTAPPADAPETKGCVITYLKPRDKNPVDYAKDVAPILQAKCSECHRPEGIGPWAMVGEEKIAGRADMIKEVVRTRRMPPWHADNAVAKYSNDRGLTIDEQRTLCHWVDEGAPRGAGADPLATLAAAKSEWPLGKPDLIVELPEQRVPATGILPYRTAEVQLDLKADVWVRAVDLRPSNTKILHHAFAFNGEESLDDLSPERAERAKKLLQLAQQMEKNGQLPPDVKEKLNARPRGLTTFFASYVPGAGVLPFPTGTGKPLKKDTKLTFQLHYTTNGEAAVDHPKLGLYFLKSPPAKELKVTSAFQLKLNIPPGVREVPTEATKVFNKDVLLYAMSPHMHYRGSWMRFTATYPDGHSELLLSVPRYDLNWQMAYSLATPKAIPAGTKILVSGAFDNSPFNEFNPDPTKALRFGEQTTDEMYIGYMVYADK